MRVLNLRTAALALVAGIGLAGCAYGPYGGLGVGVGYGNNGYYDPYYDGYGYGNGYGYGYGYGPYASRYGYGYGMPYYGWYDNFYYPGSGYYVYDRYRNPYRMSDAQRHYWEWRRKGSHSSTSATGNILQNWADFQNGPHATSTTVVRQQSVDGGRIFRTRPTAEQQQVHIERQQAQRQDRAERRQARQERFGERRRKKND